MEHYAGVDVSLESVCVCVVDGSGRIVREAKLASEPDALIGWFTALDFPVEALGDGRGQAGRPAQGEGGAGP